MSVSDRRFRFSVRAFVLPPDGAQLSGSRVTCAFFVFFFFFPRNPLSHQSESWAQRGAELKGPVLAVRSISILSHMAL